MSFNAALTDSGEATHLHGLDFIANPNQAGRGGLHMCGWGRASRRWVELVTLW